MNFRTLDLNLLRVFDLVMQERNVTRAAARLAMTQPAVSNALRRLREAVQDELFVPGPDGMLPTAQAHALWPAVREAIEGLRRVFDPQPFDPRTDERNFTLSMADATAAVLLPALMQQLQQEGAARIHVAARSLTTRDPRPMLEQGLADAAVGFFPDVAAALAAEGDASATVLDPLYSCEYVCVMRRGHALARRRQLTLDAYCAARHLRVSFAGRPRGYVDEALARQDRRRDVVLTVEHFSTAARVVSQSDLLTVLPRSYLPATGIANELELRALPLDLPRIQVGLLWHRRHHREPAQHWLRQRLAQAAVAVAVAGSKN